MKGNVILKANRRLHPNNLVLYLIGKEHTVITKATKGTRIRDYKVIARAMTTLLDPGKENIAKGIHTIPFSFMLPASLPSSEQFPKVDSRSYNGKIEVGLRHLITAQVLSMFALMSCAILFSSCSVSIKSSTRRLICRTIIRR